VSYARSRHTYKAGFQLVQERGSESYNLIPASQKALDALAQLDPRLAPAGSFQNDGMGGQKFVVDPNNPTVPTLRVRRRGFYRAAYLQDTWGMTKRLTANYGVRLDSYRQRQNLGNAPVSLTQLSPRLNFAYLVAPLTIARLSYNHLFIEPPLSQGAIIGQAIQPETLNQYEASLERQVGPGQAVKLAYYYKDIRNQIDTALLISGTQIGAYASRNLQFGSVHAFELSYDLTPRGNVGLSGYLAFAYGTNRPSGKDNTGEPVEAFNDHDQRDTLSTGVAYTLPSGASGALNLYYGSGVFSSTIGEDAPRTPRTEFNLRLTSGPQLFAGHGGLTLNVDNLFNQRKVINFQSDFSGTRFQQGRRVLLSAFGRF
jgi:outer membrane receptor protein involved in Fe transport